MKRQSVLLKRAALFVAVLSTIPFAVLRPAQAEQRVVNGQAYWEGDPGPIDPGPYWTSGQRKYDRHHYMSWYGKDPQDYRMTVYAEHSGKARCVWRRRVINTEWEFQHPYLRVCRPK